MTEKEYRAQFRAQLEKWLKKRGVTAYAMAKATGIKIAHAYKTLQGGSVPRAPLFAKILTFLNITPVEFWGLE